jgi:hypothetical protein
MNHVFLTFDLEEFDIPEEFGQSVDFETKMRMSYEGMEKILTLFRKYKVKTTIFCTACYAENNIAQIERIVADGHEIASHGYYHSAFKIEDLAKSREKLVEISGQAVRGFRMPRLQPVSYAALQEAGYTYDSSMNPTILPGRYNHLDKPRTVYQLPEITVLPTTVTPWLRIPLFWLGFKNYPVWYFQRMAKWCLKKDGYLSLYFHPWEFCDLSPYQLPSYVKRVDNDRLLKRMEQLIIALQHPNTCFSPIGDYLKQ